MPKALSIRQPWAWLIVNGYKDVENRSWWTRFRGEFFVHAGKKFDRPSYDAVREHYPHIEMPTPEEFKKMCGGLVGVATITDCVKEMDSPWFFGEYGFVIENARPIEFQEVKGQLGFFQV